MTEIQYFSDHKDEYLKLDLLPRWSHRIDEGILTIEKKDGVGALQLSFVSHMYDPMMLPPHLLELLEYMLKENPEPLLEQRILRKVAPGYEEQDPNKKTGSRSLHDVLFATAHFTDFFAFLILSWFKIHLTPWQIGSHGLIAVI